MRLLQRRRSDDPADTPGTMDETGNEWENQAAHWWNRTRGQILGTLAGLLLAWIVLRIGWGAALAIAALVYVGYSIGRSFDPD